MSLNNGTLLNVVLRTKLLNPLDTEGGGGGGGWGSVGPQAVCICYFFIFATFLQAVARM